MIRLAIAAAVVLATLLGLYVLWQFRYPIVLFLLSLAVAAAVRPLVDLLGHSGLPRVVGLTGTYIAGVLALVVLVIAVSGLLYKDVERAGRHYSEFLTHVVTTWPHGTRLQQAIARQIPPPEQIAAALTGPQGAELIQTVLGTAFSLLGSVVDLLVVLALSIYWTIDRVHFERLWLSLLPVRMRTAGRDLWRAVENEVGAYFRSEGVQSFSGGLLLGLGYWAIGFPYPTLLAVIAALAWLIPWVGIVFALLGVAVLSPPLFLLQSPGVALAVLIATVVYTLAVLLFLEIFVEPRFFNRRRYNPLLMALAVIALAEELGILGLVLGPPLAVAVQVLSGQLLRRRLLTPVEDPVPPLDSIEQRLALLKSQVAALRDPPPELTTMMDRLTELVGEAREVLPES